MRLSDAMRGAADRAPIDEVRVSTADAARRVTRGRRLHAGANALVGAGAVAVIGMAFMGGVGASDDSAADGMAASAPEEAREESGADMSVGDSEALSTEADSMLADPWLCGSTFDRNDGAWSYGDASGVTYEVGEINSAESLEAGDGEFLVPETFTAHRPVALLGGSDYVITWDGLIVGRFIGPSPIQYGPADEPLLPEGDVFETLDPDTEFSTLQQGVVLDPVNCWDGAPLPAGTYDVHLATTLAYPAATESDASTLEEGAEVVRVAGGPVTLTIDGEPVDDPFGEYLTPVEPKPEPTEPGEPGDPAPLPDNALTPDVVRDLFAASAAPPEWDMEAGTHRWVMNDSGGEAYQYFGCSWGGDEGKHFPSRSSEMDLLDLDVSAPSSLSVSYGFVVDGNPEIRSTVTNVSDYDIVDYWGSAQPQLFLVRDGVVVADGYPVSLAGDDVTIMEGEAAGDAEALIYPPPGGEGLASGDAVSGTFLWRDVNRCDTAHGGSAGVEPGVYTLLSSLSLSVSDQQVRPEPALLDEVDPDTPAAEPAIGIVPPEEYSWVDLQLWTSLGTVVVSN